MRRDAEANHRRLLDAAVTVVRRDGEHVPMAGIAAEAGVGVATLYRNFGSREDLLDAVTRHAFEMVLRCAEQADLPERSGRECLGVFLRATIAHADRLALPLHGGPPVQSAATGAVRGQVHQTLQGIVERGIGDGSLRADLTTWDVIAFGALVANPLPTSTAWSTTALRLAEIHLDGLRPVPGEVSER